MKNNFLFWGGVITVWAVVIIGTLWNNGYQYQNRRNITDQEMIRIAVSRALQAMETNPMYATCGGLSESGAIVIPYRDVDHFLEKNPKCCPMSKSRHAIYVDVFGKVFYKDSSGQIQSSEPIELLRRQYFPDSLHYRP